MPKTKIYTPWQYAELQEANRSPADVGVPKAPAAMGNSTPSKAAVVKRAAAKMRPFYPTPTGAPIPAPALPTELPTKTVAESRPRVQVEDLSAPTAAQQASLLAGESDLIDMGQWTGDPRFTGLMRSKKEVQEEAFQERQRRTMNLNYSPEEDRLLNEQVMESPGITMQKEALDREQSLGELLMKYAQPAQVDYSPLAALGDAWSGSNVLRGIPRPDNSSARKLILDHFQKVQDDTRDLGKSITDYRKGLKSGTSDIMSLFAQKSLLESMSKKDQAPGYKGDPKRSGSGNPASNAFRFGSEFEKQVKEDKEKINSAKTAVKLLENPNWAGDLKLKAAVMAGMGLGQISNYEHQMFNAPGVEARFKTMIARLKNQGNFLQEERDLVMNTLAAIAELSQKNIDEKAASWKSMAQVVGVGDSDASKIMKAHLPERFEAPKKADVVEVRRKSDGVKGQMSKEAYERRKAEFDLVK